MQPDSNSGIEAARALWAGRFQAVLATQSLAEPGYPFVSVVPYCLDRDGNALLLLSRLAQHTKNLGADPRCSLSVAEPTDEDVHRSLRLACLADCEPVDAADAASHNRWFRYFPATLPYYEQLDFSLYRLRPKRFHYNGGFATARWLGNERILRRGFDEERETDALALLASHPDLAKPGPSEDAGRKPESAEETADSELRLAGVDPWGLDLARGAYLYRIDLAEHIDDPADLLAVYSTMVLVP